MTAYQAKQRRARWARLRARNENATNWNPFRGVPFDEYLLIGQYRERGAHGIFERKEVLVMARSHESAFQVAGERLEPLYVEASVRLTSNI